MLKCTNEEIKKPSVILVTSDRKILITSSLLNMCIVMWTSTESHLLFIKYNYSNIESNVIYVFVDFVPRCGEMFLFVLLDRVGQSSLVDLVIT